MAINLEIAKENADKPAVSCCKFELGVEIAPDHLEDPAIFPDLEESGLLAIPDDCLTIGQVLGEKLIKTIPALTPITSDYCQVEGTPGEKAVPLAQPGVTSTKNLTHTHGADTVTLHIGDAKEISLTFPSNLMKAFSSAFSYQDVKPEAPTAIRSLKKRYFKIDNVVFGHETSIDGTTLTL